MSSKEYCTAWDEGWQEAGKREVKKDENEKKGASLPASAS
jgi:hypothetical protein